MTISHKHVGLNLIGHTNLKVQDIFGDYLHLILKYKETYRKDCRLVKLQACEMIIKRYNERKHLRADHKSRRMDIQ